MKEKKGKDRMKRKIKALLLVAILTLACATTSLACTPKLATPKLPTIPNITNVKFSDSVQEAVDKSAEKTEKEAVKNLKIDWSKIKFNFKF